MSWTDGSPSLPHLSELMERKRSQLPKAIAEDAAGARVLDAVDQAEHANFLVREHGPSGTVDPYVQHLFERMADVHHAKVSMEHVYADGSARIRLGEGPGSVCRRVSVVRSGDEHLAKIEQIRKGRDPSPILVTIRPSVVLAVFEL